MRLISADHSRLIRLDGVPDPVPRPVDLDRDQTGFTTLRSLRLYCFESGMVIDGHAEDDEVLMVVLTGSVRLTLAENEISEDSPELFLSAAGASGEHAHAAYLPPGGAYRLIPQAKAEVAYARATPSAKKPPALLPAYTGHADANPLRVWEELEYAQRLRVRRLQMLAADQDQTIDPLKSSESACEALIHVRTVPERGAAALHSADGQIIPLASWDTVVVKPGESAQMRLQAGSSAEIFVVFAAAADVL